MDGAPAAPAHGRRAGEDPVPRRSGRVRRIAGGRVAGASVMLGPVDHRSGKAEVGGGGSGRWFGNPWPIVNVDSGLKALDVPRLVRAADSEGDSIGLGGACDRVESEFRPFTFATMWGASHISSQLFELDWTLTGGTHVDMFGVPPHCLVHLASSTDKACPPIPESHRQSIRESLRYGGSYNKEQLFVPLSVVLEDGREMTGLWIRNDNGCVTPVFLGRESESIQRSRSGIGFVDHNNQDQQAHEFSEEAQSKTESRTSHKVENESRLFGGSDSFSSTNVNVDTPALAGCVPRLDRASENPSEVTGSCASFNRVGSFFRRCWHNNFLGPLLWFVGQGVVIVGCGIFGAVLFGILKHVFFQ